MRLVWIKSEYKQNYLEDRGILPAKEDRLTGAAAYENTEKFRKVLESFYI